MQDVKFYDAGGHSADRVMDNHRLGVIVRLSKSRFDEICKDSPETLRSPYGKPENE